MIGYLVVGYGIIAGCVLLAVGVLVSALFWGFGSEPWKAR